MSVWIENGEKQNEIELRLYAPESEMRLMELLNHVLIFAFIIGLEPMIG